MSDSPIGPVEEQALRLDLIGSIAGLLGSTQSLLLAVMNLREGWAELLSHWWSTLALDALVGDSVTTLLLVIEASARRTMRVDG
jgi:hypothetical protein